MKNKLKQEQKQNFLPWKINKITKTTNNVLSTNLDEKENLLKLRKQFDKLLKYASFFINKIESEKDFSNFIKWFEEILNNLDVKKLYNITTIFNLKEYIKRDLFMQFLYLNLPKNGNKHFSFIKWWACYHRTLFFFNLFSEIDKKWILEKKMINFSPDIPHSAFLVWFKNKKFIIDPYAKKYWLIVEVKEWNEIYLWTKLTNYISWKITNTKKLELLFLWRKIKPTFYQDRIKFIESVKSWQILNIKIQIEWKTYQIRLENLDSENLILYFNWEIFELNKEFISLDIVELFMKWKPTNYKILLKLLWFNNESLPENIKNALKIIWDKINFDYVFKKLNIYDDIQMFKSYYTKLK